MFRRFYAGVSGLLLLVVSLVTATDATADNCRRVVVPTYTAPVYHAPAYHAPTVYHQPHQVIEKVVEKVLVNHDFYFSVGDEYRELAFAKLVAAELVKLQAQQQPPAPPQAAPEASYPAPTPAPKPPGIVQPPPPKGKQANTTPGKGSPECDPVTTGLPQGFKDLVTAKCQKCHASGKAQQALDLATLDQLHTLSLAKRDRMFRSVSNGRMPKGGKVTDAELNLFNAYSALAESAVYGGERLTIPKAATK